MHNLVAWISGLSLGRVLAYLSYWALFWTAVNALLPPRETFKDFPGFLKFYNVLLLLIAYWGALNVRKLTVDLYGKMGVDLTPPPKDPLQPPPDPGK